MFALTPRKEIVIRLVLITVILLNSVISSAAMENSSVDLVESQPRGENRVTGAIVALQNEHQFQSFERPISISHEIPQQQGITDDFESSDVRLICDPANSTTFPEGNPTCTDTSPNITIANTFQTNAGINWFTGGATRFKLQCFGDNCAPPTIYYLAILDGEFATTSTFGTCLPNCTWGADLYASINFITSTTWGMQGGVCGTSPSGTCHFELSGMIPAGMIPEDPAYWNNKYFDITIPSPTME